MTFELERELIEYSYRVFDYLNGRVNQYIPAKLNIRNNFNKNILANNIFNVVNLHLWNIIDYNKHQTTNIYEINKIKVDIVFNIIHELSHIEQDLDYCIYNIDSKYADKKEKENNYNTYSFIYNNITELSTIFNIRFDIEYIERQLLIDLQSYTTYNKYNIFEYYVKCIKTLTNNDINIISYNDIFKYPNIIFILNSINYFTLKYNNMINLDINTFNDLIINYTTSTNSISNTNIYENDNILYIDCKLNLSYKFNIG